MAELQEVDAWLDALLVGLEPVARKRMMRELAQQPRRSQQKKHPDAAQPGWDLIRASPRDGPHEAGAHPSADVFKTPHYKIPESRRQPGLCQCRI